MFLIKGSVRAENARAERVRSPGVAMKAQRTNLFF
jgi:hypothetical protein